MRQELDRYSDNRLDRFRRKLNVLDVRDLANPGYHPVQYAMERMRSRAAIVAREEEESPR